MVAQVIPPVYSLVTPHLPHLCGRFHLSDQVALHAEVQAALPALPPPPTHIDRASYSDVSLTWQFEWPSMLRLKQPRRSPLSESAPQHMTMAPGWNISITCSKAHEATAARMKK